MRVHNVHARELPVPAEQVGALLDGLGGPDDRLWPSDRWPTTPFVLDGPLTVGTPSRQGLIAQTLIHQRVDDYQAGKRLVFRFTPGLGLVGSHRLEVEPLGSDRARLTHTLACRVEPKLLPWYPIFIRQHDALVEDLLDRAELQVTGRLAKPARWPASVRLANAVELGMARRQGLLPPANPARAAKRNARMDRLARMGGVLSPAALAALAALHAAWALGWRWPGDTDHALAELVLSSSERERLMTLTGSELPPDPSPGRSPRRCWPPPESSLPQPQAPAREPCAWQPWESLASCWRGAGTGSPPTSSAGSTNSMNASTWHSTHRCVWPSGRQRRPSPGARVPRSAGAPIPAGAPWSPRPDDPSRPVPEAGSTRPDRARPPITAWSSGRLRGMRAVSHLRGDGLGETPVDRRNFHLFGDGFAPAIGVSAVLALTGMTAGVALPRRRRVRFAVAEPASPVAIRAGPTTGQRTAMAPSRNLGRASSTPATTGLRPRAADLSGSLGR